MFKVLGVMFRKSARQETEAAAPPALGRAELQNLFQDDFAAHGVIEKPRRTGHVYGTMRCRESVDFLLRRASGSGPEKAGRRARSLPACHGRA